MVANNPYQAPRADLKTQAHPSHGELHQPIKVNAGRGIAWWGRGFWHFKQNPLAWTGGVFLLLLLGIATNLITTIAVNLFGPLGLVVSLIVMLAMMLLGPVLVGGLMYGCHQQQQGGDFMVRHIFAGFSRNPGQLILVGLFYFVGFIVIGGLVFGGGVALLGISVPMDDSVPPDPLAILALVLLVFAAVMPLLMAYWFAPALVAIHNRSAWSAMVMSFMGCLKNILPFLVYGLVALVALLGFGIVIGIVFALGGGLFSLLAFGGDSGMGFGIGTIGIVLGILVLFLFYVVVIAVTVSSIYAGYRDIFVAAKP